MRKITRKIIALLTVAVLIGCGSAALAAGEAAPAAEPVVAVQLDGENVTFTDAIPQVKDQRTFLPFRAVFEAMGAEVDYEGMTITARRGDKTLTMTIDSPDAVVTENGVETPIVMDVAPYVDSTTWRTYVPVRFAAQAFGCSVGWDQANYTAVIVDTEKLLEEVKADKTFTYMEKYLAYSEKYQTGIWDMDMTFDGSMNLMGGPITFAGAAEGTTEGSEKMEMDMTMTMDMRGFVAYLEEMAAAMEEAAAGQAVPADPGTTDPDVTVNKTVIQPEVTTDEITTTVMSPEEEAMLEALATEGIGLEMRADMTKGLMYMAMTGDVLEQMGMPADTWYSMDMAAMYSQLGMDWSTFMETAKTLDYEALVKTILQSAELTSIDDYAGLSTAAEAVAAFFADESFTKEGNVVTNVLSMEEEGLALGAIFSLVVEKDAVVGYELTFTMTAGEAETGAVAMEMIVSVDEKDQMFAEVAMDLAGIMGMEMTMEGGYTKGSTAPVTAPPAGATVVPYESLLTPAA